MSNQELCMFLDSILALLKTNNTNEAIRVLENGIKRIDKGIKSSSKDDDDNN